MNVKEIKEMITLMNESGLVELEIEKEGMRIRLKKLTSQRENFDMPIVVEQHKLPDQRLPKENSAGNEKAVAKTVEIKSPMVGTFYRAPAPESPPYVEVGQIIEQGQVICIIEAMKLMNEIKSEVKGKITEIIVENTEPVEFGQPLFLIEPL
ncbi:MAG: acetyl-CoA carboxylase biotin carboxyl carrier protein [Candidatus Omnitrophota bacterium]